MSEEYARKEATGKLSVLDTKPNYNMTFHRGGKQIGVLDFNGPKMVFSGDMDESAKVFFDWIARSFEARLGQEREAEREACAKVCDDKAKETFSGQCQVWGDYFARVIRARGEKT
jgi:hypothetical protein